MKYIFLALLKTLLLLGINTAYGQVTIGSGDVTLLGTILQLQNSSSLTEDISNSNKGLFLQMK